MKSPLSAIEDQIPVPAALEDRLLAQIAAPRTNTPAPTTPESHAHQATSAADAPAALGSAPSDKGHLSPRRRVAAIVAASALCGALALEMTLAWRRHTMRPDDFTSYVATPGSHTAPTVPTVPSAEPAMPGPSDVAADNTVPVRVKVLITPKDAEVEVDGERSLLDVSGILEITGGLGSVHRVRVHTGKIETTVEVAISREGAIPHQIRLGFDTPRLPPGVASPPRGPNEAMAPLKPKPTVDGGPEGSRDP